MGGVFFLFRGGELNDKKNYNIKYDEGLRWPPFGNLHATTNQKHSGVMEGGWDMLRNRARMLGERDGNVEPLAEGDKDDDDEYGEDRNIPDDDDKYAVGVDGVGEPLEEGDDQCCPRMSMPCKSAAKRALMLRASYSQWAMLRV
jgi:hypothetical protein